MNHRVSDSYITTTDSDAGLYDVRSVSSDKVYTVDMGRGYCTCYVGASGTLCKHASAVLLRADSELSSAYSIISTETKAVLFEVATGRRPPAVGCCHTIAYHQRMTPSLHVQK